MTADIEMNRGSSVPISGVWPNASGGAANLTGYDLVPYDVHPQLVGHLTLTLVNAAAGSFTGLIAWQEDMPDGRVMHFRMRLVPQAGFAHLLPVSTKPILVLVV